MPPRLPGAHSPKPAGKRGLGSLAPGQDCPVTSYDYEVDLENLGKAAQGLADTVQLFKDKDVEDLVPTEGDLGSSTVWSAVEEFKNRWEEGVNNLCKDVEEMAGRVGKIAMNYYEADQQGLEELKGAAGTVSAVDIMGGP